MCTAACGTNLLWGQALQSSNAFQDWTQNRVHGGAVDEGLVEWLDLYEDEIIAGR